MISIEYILIISLFVIYYFAVLLSEKKIIREPDKIISRFLSIVLLYAGISLIYFSITGRGLFGASTEGYSVYIFIIGFVSILWTIPELLSEFEFFKRFLEKREIGKKEKIVKDKLKRK